MRALYGRHSFPWPRITWRVRRARKVHTCDGLQPPGRHTATIHTGDEYVGVGMRPEKGRTGGWSHVKLCASCAAGYGLVELETLEELKAT